MVNMLTKSKLRFASTIYHLVRIRPSQNLVTIRTPHRGNGMVSHELISFFLGIIVDCQVHKSQSQNKQIAFQKLRSKLYEIECEKVDSSVRNLRKIQVS